MKHLCQPNVPVSQALGPTPEQLAEIAATMSKRGMRPLDAIVEAACILRERSEFKRKFESKLARVRL